MTAPQHTAQPKADREDSTSVSTTPVKKHTLKSYQVQRCWFIGTGLLGSFGFVVSQMSFAFAYSDADFLITDYSGDSGSAVTSYSVADTSFTLPEPAYEAASISQPLPEAFIEAPAAAAAESWVSESWAPEPAPVTNEAAFVEAAPVAVPATPAPAGYTPPAEPMLTQPVTVQPAASETTAASPSASPISASQTPTFSATTELAPVAADSDSLAFESTVSVATAATSARELEPTTPAAQQANTQQASVQERTISSESPVVTPEVSAVAPPAFTVSKKDSPIKAARRAGPLAGMLEASAVAAPLSAYMSGTTLLAMEGSAEALSVDTAPVVEPALEPAAPPAAVPDILPEALPAPVEAAPIVEIAPVEAAPVQATELVPAALPEGTNLPEEYNSVFVDPTDYSVGATEAPAADTPQIVVSEQSTGCEFTVGAGQAVPNGACASTPANGLAPAPAPVAEAGTQQFAGGSAQSVAPVAAAQPTAPVASAPAVNVGPVSFSASGIRFSGGTTAAGRDYLNRSVRPLVNLQAAQRFIFPLAVPSPITSLFGFRIHPITGDQRFHGGTDIGAAQGTPVLAAQDGFVELAGNGGGYGLLVELSHEVEETQLRTRYAHLSEILVEAGSEVKKGDVIGLVGSTGNSTGPHLHFEMMQATADGWVLVNPDSIVQNSLANLVDALNNPMQAVSFNLSDFNLNRVDASKVTAEPSSLIEVPGPGQNGIAFRPAQPNAR